MKIVAIEHSAGDTAAAAGEIAQQLGHSLRVIRVESGDAVPMTADADVLMIFGGAASLAARNLPAWIEPERELVRKYVAAGRRVLGICLGSQIVASALGAPVRRNENPEVGWHLVERVDRDFAIADVFPEQFVAFHWHQDTFGIPDGARHIIRSEGCEHQGFVLEDRVFGFQCHLEANPRTVDIFLAASKMHRQPGRFVQTDRQIRQGTALYLAKQTEILSNFLSRWLGVAV